MRGIEAMKSAHTGVPGWHTEAEENALIQLVKDMKATSPLIIVELGGEYGRSASEFAWALKDSGQKGRVFSVDTFPTDHEVVGDLLEAYTANLKECGLVGYVTPIRNLTAQQGRKWGEPIDLLFVDAGHTYAAVKADIDAWIKHVKPKGWVVFHDYAKSPADHPVHHDVKRAVDEWHKANTPGWAENDLAGSLIGFWRVPDEAYFVPNRQPEKVHDRREEIEKRILTEVFPPLGKIEREPDRPDYANMDWTELKALASERGVTARKKGDIIKELEAQDND